MLRRTFTFAIIASTLSLIAAHATAAAQRAFVASYGSAANTAFNCSITKPCRSFSDAISVTSSHGEVVVLDSAGYGPMTITQAVSIIAPPGVYAGVSVFSGDGIVVDAGDSDKVALRGLAINGQGGDRGIVYLNGAQLDIDRCVVSGMGGTGIEVGPRVAGITTIVDTIVEGNNEGIRFMDRDNGGVSPGLLASVRVMNNNNFGLRIGAGAEVRVSTSVFYKNIVGGVRALPTIGGNAIVLDVTNSIIAANGSAGIELYGPPSFLNFMQGVISDNVITDHYNHGISVGTDATGPGMRVVLTRNHVRGTTAAIGILVFGLGTEVLLSGNVVTKTDSGIRIEPSAIVHSKGDNVVDGNTQDKLGTVSAANVL